MFFFTCRAVVHRLGAGTEQVAVCIPSDTVLGVVEDVLPGDHTPVSVLTLDTPILGIHGVAHHDLETQVFSLYWSLTVVKPSFEELVAQLTGKTDRY